ncbi:HAMP domain-containing sensor histidine kinase [Streptomyces sp. DT2A-34]|uniref:sensor histidine kinase n=1 Tax=Streptomyces sp. DT2A-34 TaxID=3051182 RepID=UPI00265C8772|nr:HAMP domain-containing sensor histidine kinase [Streptomyces sp. DT2A-34]MDO0911255.1 HAMP domain-containing sensor histidine kinase [Streptomyces sp. DT2A-34]
MRTAEPAPPKRAVGMPGRHPFRSIRVRLLGRMLVLVGLTLASLTGAESFILTARLNERVDRELAHDIEAFRSFATGTAGGSGPAPGGVRALFVSYLEGHIPAHGQTLITLVDGVPYRRSAEKPPARLDTDRALMSMAAKVRSPSYGDAKSPAGSVRFVAVPVTVAGDSARGVLVIATFTQQERDHINDSIRIQIYLGLGAVLLSACVGWIFASRIVAPLRLLRDTARSIHESDITRRIPVQDRDEIGQLADTFNDMLDHLDDAFTTKRQFMNDVGHELRTPITIVLSQLESLPDDSADRAQTVAVITDELHRMHRMAEELLMLAKARRPDALRPEDLSLSELIEEVYVKAAALAERRWLLDFVENPHHDTLHADRQLLTQAMIQLAQNAAQHTEEHARIWIGGRAAADRVELWVKDTGPGIRLVDQQRIFERFVRAEESRGRTGAGLGLAIVKAIAEAHHGEIHVDSAPGRGATFTLRIPYVTRALNSSPQKP